MSLLVGAPVHLVTPRQWQHVSMVHQCEGDAWHLIGPTYSGGLGWRPATWLTYRLSWMPSTMDAATPQEQALAMVRFVDHTLHYWPDWPSCTGGY